MANVANLFVCFSLTQRHDVGLKLFTYETQVELSKHPRLSLTGRRCYRSGSYSNIMGTSRRFYLVNTAAKRKSPNRRRGSHSVTYHPHASSQRERFTAL